jgi:hypothetical protein
VRDPLSRIPATARLWAAAVVTLVPLGLLWSVSAGLYNPGYTYYGDCGYTDSTYCTPDTYIPGYYVPGQTSTVAQSPLRLFLVVAALGFVVAALHRRTGGTRLLVRLATLALGWAVVYAVGHGSFRVAALLVIALALTVPLVWRGRGHSRRPGVLATSAVPR